MEKRVKEFNILVVEDQPTSIECFIRRLENHVISLDDVTYEARYHYLYVKLARQNKDSLWTIHEDSIDELASLYREVNFDLILIDFAYVPPEKDEELTYKLNHFEIKDKKELLGIYVVDAYELYKRLFQRFDKLKKRVMDKRIKYLIYTYPADSLMHLLGDAKQRGNKLSHILRTKLDILDTRQLLYGGDKELENQHNRQLYPQLLGGYLNYIVLNNMFTKILSIIPQYKKVKVKKSVLSVTTIAGFAAGVGFLTDFLAKNVISLWSTNMWLSISLLLFLMIFIFSAGSFFAIFFERLVRNLVIWLEEEEENQVTKTL